MHDNEFNYHKYSDTTQPSNRIQSWLFLELFMFLFILAGSRVKKNRCCKNRIEVSFPLTTVLQTTIDSETIMRHEIVNAKNDDNFSW